MVWEWILGHLPDTRKFRAFCMKIAAQNLPVDIRQDREIAVVDWDSAQIGDAAYGLAIVTRTFVDPSEAHMERDQLRALQAPLKQRYREHPGSALITLRADGSLEERVACSVSTGTLLVEAGLHPATGGTGLEACSGDMLLQALVACAGVTLTAVATALGVKLRGGRVTAEGDLDVRGTLGIEKDVPVGFK